MIGCGQRQKARCRNLLFGWPSFWAVFTRSVMSNCTVLLSINNDGKQAETDQNQLIFPQTNKKKKRVAHHWFSKQSPLNEFPHGHCPWNYSLGFLGLPGKMFSEEDLWGINPVDSPSKSLKRFLMNPVSLRVSTRYAVTMWCAHIPLTSDLRRSFITVRWKALLGSKRDSGEMNTDMSCTPPHP